ncbi:hypothetical protein B0H17DRAFT_1132831 [Mycena rosella]|uniref:Uncharacterized protein n=1 Tax=Mycena rosella TaxID=1033263 RepID=A0AAD7DLB1_MYCRO|nr:hypothetical protein B0H17DRAFT_1132831 [Mycena rosella]
MREAFPENLVRRLGLIARECESSKKGVMFMARICAFSITMDIAINRWKDQGFRDQQGQAGERAAKSPNRQPASQRVHRVKRPVADDAAEEDAEEDEGSEHAWAGAVRLVGEVREVFAGRALSNVNVNAKSGDVHNLDSEQVKEHDRDPAPTEDRDLIQWDDFTTTPAPADAAPTADPYDNAPAYNYGHDSGYDHDYMTDEDDGYAAERETESEADDPSELALPVFPILLPSTANTDVHSEAEVEVEEAEVEVEEAEVEADVEEEVGDPAELALPAMPLLLPLHVGLGMEWGVEAEEDADTDADADADADADTDADTDADAEHEDEDEERNMNGTHSTSPPCRNPSTRAPWWNGAPKHQNQPTHTHQQHNQYEVLTSKIELFEGHWDRDQLKDIRIELS